VTLPIGFAYRVFGWCVQIIESSLVSEGLPCRWFLVVGKCRFTRQFMVMGEAQVKAGFAKDSAVSSRTTFFLASCRKQLLE